MMNPGSRGDIYDLKKNWTWLSKYAYKPVLGSDGKEVELGVPVHGDWLVGEPVGDVLGEGVQLLLCLLLLSCWGLATAPQIFQHCKQLNLLTNNPATKVSLFISK